MLDQSFSSKSFQEIFDKENRKGINVEEKYKTDFVDSMAKVSELKALRKQIQQDNEAEEEIERLKGLNNLSSIGV